jgi:hypothetical protein
MDIGNTFGVESSSKRRNTLCPGTRWNLWMKKFDLSVIT